MRRCVVCLKSATIRNSVQSTLGVCEPCCGELGAIGFDFEALGRPAGKLLAWCGKRARKFERARHIKP